MESQEPLRPHAKFLHGVVAVHAKSNNLDQAASSFPFYRESSRNHLEWA